MKSLFKNPFLPPLSLSPDISLACSVSPCGHIHFLRLSVLSGKLTLCCNSSFSSFLPLSLNLTPVLLSFPPAPEEERGEGRPRCRLCAVQMLFHLIHQCQRLSSAERQDAGEREVMKAL